jgi:hypothetical protein
MASSIPAEAVAEYHDDVDHFVPVNRVGEMLS